MDEKSIRCFRCGAQPKILIAIKIDDSIIKMCPLCVADFGLFLQGYVIDRMVRVEKGHRISKKEDDE